MAPPDPPRAIVRLPIVDSTQRVAFELAERGEPDGAVVVAGTQTVGRGRRGRTWHDAPGDSLLASIIVRPRLDPRDLPMLSLTAAVAVGEALRAVAPLHPRLKWPNDVLVGGRKIAGILLESRIAPAPVVVVGVGINLRQRSFPDVLSGVATSVLLESSRTIAPDTMLDALLVAFDGWRERLEREGFAPVRAAWLAVADTIGRVVEADGRTGTAVDVDRDGALLVRDPDGLRRVTAGDVVTVRGGAAD